MKKSFKTLFSLCASAALMVGCSQSAKDSLKSDDSKSNGSASGEAIEIEYWYGLGSVAGETMEEIIGEFNASQDEVVVKGVAQASYDDTLKELQAALAAKKAPAVFINGSPRSTVEQDFVEPMDDLPSDLFNEGDYLDVFWEQGIINDKRYGLPGYGTTQVMYYRHDILEKAGIDGEEMYSSWENIRKYSEELIKGGHVDQGHLPMYGSGNMIDIALSNGGSVYSEDGKTVTINSPEWVEAWSFIQKGIQDKIWHVNSGGQGWEYWYNTIDEVMVGKAAGYTGSSGDKGDLDFEIISSTEQPGLNGNEGKPTAGGHQFSISKGTPEDAKQAAYKFIAYFMSPEVQSKWSQKIGYIPVNKKTIELDEYAKFLEENPAYAVPYQQALHATPSIVDPTGGKITDAIGIAVDKVQLEGIDPKTALDEAQKKAQEALDEYLAKQ